MAARLERLEGLLLVDAVLDVQRDASRARSEEELLLSFASRFHDIGVIHEVSCAVVVDARRGSYRVMSRIDVRGGGITRDTLRARAAGVDAMGATPVYDTGIMSRVVRDPSPKLIYDLQPEHEPALQGFEPGPRNALAIPVFVRGEILEWLLLTRDTGDHFTHEEVRMSIAVLNMLSRGVDQLRMTHELESMRDHERNKIKEVARIQRSLLPREPAQDPALDYAAFYRPCDLAGGDYHDFTRFDDGTFGFMIADASGHGPGAAVVMAILRTAMAVYGTIDIPVTQVVEGTNALLANALDGGMFVTAFFMRIDPKTGAARYSNAGHNPPRIRRASGTIETIDGAGSLPLGVLPQIDVEFGTLHLSPGDAIVLYTDGITEAFSPTRELFGDGRLEHAIQSAEPISQAILDRIVRDVDAHAASADHADDQCIVVIRYAPHT